MRRRIQSRPWRASDAADGREDHTVPLHAGHSMTALPLLMSSPRVVPRLEPALRFRGTGQNSSLSAGVRTSVANRALRDGRRPAWRGCDGNDRSPIVLGPFAPASTLDARVRVGRSRAKDQVPGFLPCFTLQAYAFVSAVATGLPAFTSASAFAR